VTPNIFEPTASENPDAGRRENNLPSELPVLPGSYAHPAASLPEFADLPLNHNQSISRVGSEVYPLGPQPYYREPEKGALGLKEMLAIAGRRWPLVLGLASLTFAAATAWTLTRQPVYSTNFQLLVRPLDPNADLANVTGATQPGMAQQSGAGLETMISVLTTPKVMEPAIISLQREYPGYSLQELYNNLVVTQVKNADILTVTVNDKDPMRAKVIAERLSQVYISYSDSLNKTSLNQGISFVNRQLPELQARVQSLQQQLKAFRQRYTLVDPDTRAQNVTAQLGALQQRREETQTSIIETQGTYNNLQRQLGNRAPAEAITASTMSTSTAYQGLLAKLREAEVAVAQASVTYQPEAPQMQALVETRDKLLSLLSQESKRILGNRRLSPQQANMSGIEQELNNQLVQTANTLQALQIRARALGEAESRLRKDFELYPDLSRQHTDLQRQLKIATASLERLLETRESLEIKAAQQAQPWKLLSAAALPREPISPNIPRNLTLGLLGALLLGGGAALLAEKFKDVFHSVDDLRSSVTLPILGIVPYQKLLLRLKPQVRSNALLEDVTGDTGYTANGFTESFRSLFSSLQFLESEVQVKSLVISSATPAEGKSTTAYNLAMGAAAMGLRVLLVDADLRRPTVHDKAGLPNIQGLSNVLTLKVPVQEVMQQSARESNLYVITSGPTPPDPTRLLSSETMKQLMQQLHDFFDLVVYDAPPLLGFADSLLLSPKTNGCLMVVGLGHSERAAVREALEQCRVSRVPMLGIAANCRAAYTQQHNLTKYYSYYAPDNAAV
jgi:capsular exopolysaccharide synthesis family protein